MSDVTRLLDAAAAGDRQAAADLLPLVYDELRKLAAARMAAEAPGHTLDGTALVHEAYLRLVGPAAARRKGRVRHGGGRRRVELTDPPAGTSPEDLLALDDALERLAARDPVKAE